MLLTHMTATGREAGRALFGDRVVQAWLPYDVPFAVARASSRISGPRGLPDGDRAVAQSRRRAARRACRSSWSTRACRSARPRGYARFAALTRPMLQRCAGVAAQSAADAARLAALGAARPIVTGNLKFDVGVPDNAQALGASLRLRFGAARPVLSPPARAMARRR